MNLPNLPKDKQKIGAWCAATYDGEIYRAVIKSSNFYIKIRKGQPIDSIVFRLG